MDGLHFWLNLQLLWYLTCRAVKSGLNVLKLWRFPKRYGQGVKKHCGVSHWRQFFSILWLVWRHQMLPAMYYRHRLYRMPLSRAPLYVTGSALAARIQYMMDAFGADLYDLKDKRRFEAVCHREGLAVAGTLAVFDQGRVQWSGAEHLPETDLFCKEAAAGKGAGADTWEYSGQRQWRGMDGRLWDEKSLLEHIAEVSLTNPLVLQTKLSNHPELAPLSPGGISSFRVLTSIDPETDEISVIAATLKMFKAGQVTDHWSRGGVACGVDIKTGVLRAASYRQISRAWEDIHQHPDTGEQITGRQLSRWSEVMALTIRAHHYFRQYPSLGWDVALTPEGPVLLEGNVTWDARLIQQPCDYALGAPEFFRHYLGWYRRAVQKSPHVKPDIAHYHGWHASLKALKEQP